MSNNTESENHNIWEQVVHLLNNNEFDEALSVLHNADKDNLVTLEFYGTIYQGKDDLYRAINYYKQSCEKGMNYSNHYNLGNALLMDGRFDEAIKVSEKAVNQYPDHSRALVTIGQAFFNKNDYRTALDYFHRAEAIEPNYVTVNRKLGRTYILLGNMEFDNPNSEKGIKYFIKAARMGDRKCQQFLNDNGFNW